MTRADRNLGLSVDVLFVGATRPPMRWGVTFSALMFNLVFTMECFLLTKNLLTLLLAVPIHAIACLLCARDARFFDLAVLSARTAIPAWLSNRRFWRSNSYSPLWIDFPYYDGRRRAQEPMGVILATERAGGGAA